MRSIQEEPIKDCVKNHRFRDEIHILFIFWKVFLLLEFTLENIHHYDFFDQIFSPQIKINLNTSHDYRHQYFTWLIFISFEHTVTSSSYYLTCIVITVWK